jgi:hypothetical protein
MRRVKNSLRSPWLGFILFFTLLFFLSSIGLSADEKKDNGITCFLGGYANKDSYIKMSFSLEYEKRISRRFALAAGMGYAPLSPFVEYGPGRQFVESPMKYDAQYRFKNKIDSGNFSQLSDGGFALLFDFGCYIYLPDWDRKTSCFIYIGSTQYMVCENFRMFDNESPLTESLSLWKSYSSFINVGLGFRHRFGGSYSIRGEWRLKGRALCFGGEGYPLSSFMLGFSYHF